MKLNKSFFLKAALFATGLAGIVAEYVLSTLATYFLGDSITQWTMIVSIMLFSMGLGSRLSKSFDNNLLVVFIGIEFMLSFITSYVVILTYCGLILFKTTGFIIYFLSILIGLLIGMEIPLAIRLNDQYQALRVNISSVLEKDYYGSLLGGVFFAFVGLPYLGMTYTPFVLGGINFLVSLGLIFLLTSELTTSKRSIWILISVIMLGIWAVGLMFSSKIIDFGESLRYKDPIVFSAQTRYQKIVMTKRHGDFWLFINGNQQLSSIDEQHYHEPLVHPVMSLVPNPAEVLILGGGDGCAVREILKHNSVNNITLVDLDSEMVKLAKEHPLLTELNLNALVDPRVEVFIDDAFHFLEKNNRTFDVIIIDLPDPKTVDLGRLYTQEFYQLCHNRLSEYGALITQAGSPQYAANAFYCIEKTIKSADFQTVALNNQVLTMGQWGWVIGSKREVVNLKEVIKNTSFAIPGLKYLNSETALMITSFGKNAFGLDSDLLTTNKLHDPVLYKYYLGGNWWVY